MLIEFDLTLSVRLGRYQALLKLIDEWAEQHQVQYRIKRKYEILRITFDDERYYHWFALTWPHNWAKYRIVESRTN